MIEKVKKGLLREINRELKKVYDVELPKDLEYFRRKERIYGIKKEKLKDILEIEGLKIEAIGIRILNLEKDGIRLTIEGAQILGKDAKRNILEISEEDVEKFLAGEDIEITKSFDYPYIIVKSKRDIIGVGRIIKEKKLRPYIPKERRIPKKYLPKDSS